MSIDTKFTTTYSVDCDWQNHNVYKYNIPRHGYVAEITVEQSTQPYDATVYVQGSRVWERDNIACSPYTIPHHIHMLNIPWPHECVLSVHAQTPDNTPKISVSYDVQKEHLIEFMKDTLTKKEDKEAVYGVSVFGKVKVHNLTS